MAIIIAILGFNLLIIVHELGHYLLAKAVGMRASKFSIGFGPSIFRIHGKETVFQFALIPVGGYVQLAGMGAAQEGDIGHVLSTQSDPRDYDRRPLWQRALVVSAGPLFNFAFAIITYSILFGSSQAVAFEWKRKATTVVRDVSGAAEKAGVKRYDVIEKINGQTVRSFTHLRELIGKHGGQPMQVLVARSPDGQPPPFERINLEKHYNQQAERLGEAKVKGLLGEDYLERHRGLVRLEPSPPSDWSRITLELTAEKTEKGFRMGIVPEVARLGADSVSSAITLGVKETWTVTATILKTLFKWAQGKEEAQVASVVKITEIGADTVKMGSEWFLSLLAILSINLGLLNLLPFPALDGGRLVFIGIEAISRRPVPKKFEMVVHAIGMVLLMTLMAVVIAREIAEKFQ